MSCELVDSKVLRWAAKHVIEIRIKKIKRTSDFLRKKTECLMCNKLESENIEHWFFRMQYVERKQKAEYIRGYQNL